MLVDGRAQVVHDALADLVREQRLDDAEHAGDDGDRDHRRNEQVQQAQVMLGERGVEDLLDQEGRDRSERGGDDDQPEHAGEPGAVRAEEDGDPAQVRAADGRIGRPLRRFREVERMIASPGHPSQGTERRGACAMQAPRRDS